MKHLLTKIASAILLTFFLTATMPVGYAKVGDQCSNSKGCGDNEKCDLTQNPSKCVTKELKDHTFSVTKNLSTGLGVKDTEPNYFKQKNPIVYFLVSVIEFATTIIGTIAVIILIIGGFIFMFAQGNQTQVDEGKDLVKYALIGLVVTFLSYLIVVFVQSLFVTAEAADFTSSPDMEITVSNPIINLIKVVLVLAAISAGSLYYYKKKK